MKRLIRALSLCLLLAIVLSAFGMFSTFAAESKTADTQLPEYRVLCDLEKKTNPAMKNVGGDKYKSYPNLIEHSEGNQPYWSISFEGVKAGTAGNGDDFHAAFEGLWDVRIRDDKGNGDARPAAEKNTDYMVIDLDLSTNTEFINNIYFNLRVLQSGSTGYKDKIVKGGLPMYKRTDDGSFVVCNDDGTNVVSPILPIDGKWAHVTLVYDFTGSANVTYVYIDGYYCGTIKSVGDNGALIYFARLQTGEGSTISTDDMTTNLANFTIKTIPSSYSGYINENGVLGNTALTLDKIPELAYCMEDLPESDKLADIIRGGETIPVYSADDLTADLKDGDTVKLYQKLTEKIFVEGGATVTILDTKGNDVTASYVNEIPAGSKWIAITGSDVSYGSASATAGNDPLYSAISDSARTKLILLEDYVSYGNASKTAAAGLVIDLNGNKLTANISGGAYVNATEKGVLQVKDGSLELVGGSLIAAATKDNIAILDGVNVTADGAVISQAQGGIASYNGCTVNGIGQLINSANGTYTSININNTTAQLTGASAPIAIVGAANAESTAWLTINGSKLTADNAVISTDLAGLGAPAAFSFTLDAAITDTSFNGAYIYEQLASGADAGAAYGEDYSYVADIDFTDVTVALTGGSSIINKACELPASSILVDIYGEITLPTNNLEGAISYQGSASSANDSVELLSDGGSWILRSLPEIAGYYSYTSRLDSHSYIYNGHEYEFYAYLGDPVDENNIPAQLPAGSEMFSYRWEYNIDGAYEIVVDYKGVIKANVTASDSLALNVYLPDNFGADAYNYVYVNGNKAEVRDVTAPDGTTYKAITIPGIDPTSATKDFAVKFRAKDENGTVEDIVCNVSVLDYIETALKSASLTSDEKQLVASLLNYIAKAEKYASLNGENSAAVNALLNSEEYGAIVLTAPTAGTLKTSIADAGVFSGIRLALDTNITYELAIKDSFSGEITVSYTKGGKTVTETMNVKGGDIVKISMLAYELDTTVTVSTVKGVGEINLAGYMSIVPESAKTESYTALADAIAIYAAAAKAFMN